MVKGSLYVSKAKVWESEVLTLEPHSLFMHVQETCSRFQQENIHQRLNTSLIYNLFVEPIVFCRLAAVNVTGLFWGGLIKSIKQHINTQCDQTSQPLVTGGSCHELLLWAYLSSSLALQHCDKQQQHLCVGVAPVCRSTAVGQFKSFFFLPAPHTHTHTYAEVASTLCITEGWEDLSSQNWCGSSSSSIHISAACTPKHRHCINMTWMLVMYACKHKYLMRYCRL